jgi:hypothetical protein
VVDKSRTGAHATPMRANQDSDMNAQHQEHINWQAIVESMTCRPQPTTPPDIFGWLKGKDDGHDDSSHDFDCTDLD